MKGYILARIGDNLCIQTEQTTAASRPAILQLAAIQDHSQPQSSRLGSPRIATASVQVRKHIPALHPLDIVLRLLRLPLAIGFALRGGRVVAVNHKRSRLCLCLGVLIRFSLVIGLARGYGGSIGSSACSSVVVLPLALLIRLALARGSFSGVGCSARRWVEFPFPLAVGLPRGDRGGIPSSAGSIVLALAVALSVLLALPALAAGAHGAVGGCPGAIHCGRVAERDVERQGGCSFGLGRLLDGDGRFVVFLASCAEQAVYQVLDLGEEGLGAAVDCLRGGLSRDACGKCGVGEEQCGDGSLPEGESEGHFVLWGFSVFYVCLRRNKKGAFGKEYVRRNGNKCQRLSIQ
ncbi:hypothetical protein B0T19DRAFT_3119 [Cercophora scortea]|uniref:Uncharacterized protein n=1 Tax=Cercophora scortea TaxID=314031 RepID=A0AAE0J207_9PEZI|nr:hypothetical protein B0T19DRAFT_3119 [Cercophora scortea]